MSQRDVSLLEYLRSSSTISLNGHSTQNVPMYHARSSKLLISRGACYPAMAVDQSKELTEETDLRRHLHSRILEQDPAAFHRKRSPTSLTSNLMQAQLLSDLLGTMHPTKDPNDLDKSKKITKSLRPSESARAIEEIERARNSKPLEDFIRPHDVSSVRKTGYTASHIRSLLKLDINGPVDSTSAAAERASGQLPQILPNPDRYAKQRNHAVGSSASSRVSTAQSFSPNNSFASDTSPVSSHPSHSTPQQRYRKTLNDVPIANSLRSIFEEYNDPKSLLTIPSSLRSGKYSPGESRVTPEDRMYVDSRLKRNTWHKNYVQGKKVS